MQSFGASPHGKAGEQTSLPIGTSAAETLSPSFPERAAWGTAGKLRKWQAEALESFLTSGNRDFLAVATPGAGKTTFALRVATELLSRGEVEAVTVVAPTEHLKTQWADSAARVGLQLDPKFSNSSPVTSSQYHGVALTYAQVAANPEVHARRTKAARTLVILDEVHHGGDGLSWGDALLEAFDHGVRRLCLTGTPFRSDSSKIPFVAYEEDAEGIRRSRGDYVYGYSDALRDGVVRPVLFMAYSGEMRWRTKAGDELAARLGEPLTKDFVAHAWRTALDPKGEWIRAVFVAADKRLTEVRRGVADAGGLVIATDQKVARAYAKILREVTGQGATVVLSDDGSASAKIEEFAASNDRWMVAVRMVSEGVDIPRLAVGVYATSASTPLYFAQVVGRFVRARKRGETASIFLPSVPTLLELGSTLEKQRDHALDRPSSGEESEMDAEADELARANAEEQASDDLFGSFEALGSQADFDHVMYEGGQFGVGADVGSQEELDFLGIPGLLEPEQVGDLLRQRQREHVKKQSRRPEPAQDEPVALHRQAAALRKELHKLVAAYAQKAGVPHAHVHADLRRMCGGPEVGKATSDQVQARITKIRGLLVGRR